MKQPRSSNSASRRISGPGLRCPRLHDSPGCLRSRLVEMDDWRKRYEAAIAGTGMENRVGARAVLSRHYPVAGSL